MISLELSSIQQKDAERAMHAVAIAEFLLHGGKIFQAEPTGHVVKEPTYSTIMPPRRKPKAVEPGPESEPSDGRAEMVAKIREMAKTMTQREITKATGLSRKQLYTISANHEFNFKTALKMSSAEEESLVLKIRECLDNRLSRNQARLHIGISFTLLTRLIRDYKIPYPMAIN